MSGGYEVTGRIKNTTGKDGLVTRPSTIAYNRRGEVIGFSTEISNLSKDEDYSMLSYGRFISDKYNYSDISSLSVWVQANGI